MITLMLLVGVTAGALGARLLLRRLTKKRQ